MDEDEIKTALEVGTFIALALAVLIMTFSICTMSIKGMMAGGFLGTVSYFLWRFAGHELFPSGKL